MPRFEDHGSCLDYVKNKKNGGGLLGYSYDRRHRNGIGRGLQADGSYAEKRRHRHQPLWR
jgi:hypothetical protein